MGEWWQRARRARDRFTAWTERSERVFLVLLVVAFAAQVVSDWNSTFGDINTLRSQLRSKGLNYAQVLRLAAEDPLTRGDAGRLGELAGELTGDDEVAAVRFAGPDGATLAEAGTPLEARYGAQLQRDVADMLADPAALRARIAQTSPRDVFQTVANLQARLQKAGAARKPSPSAALLAWQDRVVDTTVPPAPAPPRRAPRSGRWRRCGRPARRARSAWWWWR